LLTLFAFGLAPLSCALRVWPSEAIAGARVVGRGHRSYLRNILVGAQVALSVVLVGGAVVLLRALSEASEIYPGYDTSRPLALLWATPGDNSRADVQVYADALDRISATAGVQAVTYARHLPLVGSGAGATISVFPEGAAPDAPPARIYFNLVGPRFFEVMGVRMLSGRIFADADHNAAAPVAILNAEAARRFWPGQNPIGKMLRIRQDAYQVAGIMANGRIGGLHEQPAPVICLPASRMRWGETILIARTQSDPAPIVKELARTAAQTRGLRIYQSAPLRTVMKQALYDDWIPTVLGGALAIIGLLLAAGGLYGAASYATERRLSEFGVRVAVGARTSDIAGLVFRQGAMLCAAGVPVGILMFVAVYRFQAAVLLRGRPLDPLALLIAAAVTTLTVLAGTVVPAMRAARVDPVQVLRAE
jgi:predicted permease